ncbi:MAG: PQQ-binding-like beta-propeller repeat protein, partial [Planctomycetota bacterium]
EGQKELWRVSTGTMTMRAPVVHGDHIYVGSNNGHGYLERFPSSFDLGVLLCFRKSDGEFLWQHSNHKLPTGRIHDWPQSGITSRPCVSGERLFYVTNRGEVVCLDTLGFRDSQNDGALQDEVHVGPNEADIVWRLDMIQELGVQPHNVSTCTIAAWDSLLLVVTGNGVGASHQPPLSDAPSFIAIDSRTGRLVWQDNSPGQNVLHGQWGSPTVVDRGLGEPQVIFPGGDGWLYSFDLRSMKEGKTTLIWKYDCNPKESKWNSQGRGTRNNLIHGPTLFGEHCFVATGRDPEHGGGPGRLSSFDIRGKGDVSPKLVYNKRAPKTPIDHRREQACVIEKGDFTRPNPNSQETWCFEQADANDNGSIELEEKMSRSISAIAISDQLLFISDIEGILHCLDRDTGKQHWGYDTSSRVVSTPVVNSGHVYLGTVDGDILVFKCSADLTAAAPNGQPLQRIECGSSVNASVVTDGDVLYFTTKNELIAVENKAMPKETR